MSDDNKPISDLDSKPTSDLSAFTNEEMIHADQDGLELDAFEDNIQAPKKSAPPLHLDNKPWVDETLCVVDQSINCFHKTKDVFSKLGFKKIEHYTSAEEFLAKNKELKEKSICIEIILDDFDGIEFAKYVLSQEPEAHVFFYSYLVPKNFADIHPKLVKEHFIGKHFPEAEIFYCLEKIYGNEESLGSKKDAPLEAGPNQEAPISDGDDATVLDEELLPEEDI